MTFPNVTKTLLEDFRYMSAGDAQMRLGRTIVRYDGQPIYVSEAAGVELLCWKLYGDFAPFKCHSSDVLLDVSSPPLGWTNLTERNDNGPFYLSRSPTRSQRQGLALGHVDYLCPGISDHFMRGLSMNGDPKELAGIGKSIRGEFPKISECAHGFGGAFDRDWAISNPTKGKSSRYFIVFHKATPVGTFFRDTGTFLFRKGRLTKTRRLSLESLIFHAKNFGGGYAIKEQKLPV